MAFSDDNDEAAMGVTGVAVALEADFVVDSIVEAVLVEVEAVGTVGIGLETLRICGAGAGLERSVLLVLELLLFGFRDWACLGSAGMLALLVMLLLVAP